MLKKSLLLSAACLLVSAAVAHANTIAYTAAGTDTDGHVSASAIITTGSNSLTVILSSLQVNPTADGQELSGILITLGSAPTSNGGFTSETGNLINISGSGVATADTIDTITHWGTGLSGSTVCLETVSSPGGCAPGGKPIDLIIGSGSFTNANPSITKRNPQIDGTGTFAITLNGVTSLTTVTGVQFEFGTSGNTFFDGTVSTSPVPEPSSLLLLGSGIISAAGLIRRRFIA